VSEGYHHDGSFVQPVQQGAIEPIVDDTSHSLLYRVRYWQSAQFFRPLPIGSRGPKGSWKVEPEEVTTDIGGGILSFERIFAVKPKSHNEYESYVYNYQAVAGSELIELPAPVNSRILHEYFKTFRPDQIEQLVAYKLARAGNTIYAMGEEPDPGALEILAENSALERWRGNIWLRRSRWVKQQEIFDVLTP
jgi:hypothetical protein